MPAARLRIKTLTVRDVPVRKEWLDSESCPVKKPRPRYCCLSLCHLSPISYRAAIGADTAAPERRHAALQRAGAATAS